MKELIDKATVVVEIKKRIKEAKSMQPKFDQFWAGQISAFKGVLKIIDTLEVKEVDLEKELNDFIEEQKAWIKDDRVVEYNNGDSFNHIYDLEPVAKYFFELGLKTKKGE